MEIMPALLHCPVTGPGSCSHYNKTLREKEKEVVVVRTKEQGVGDRESVHGCAGKDCV